MFNQSGIDKFTLYDARTTTFDRVSTTEVTNITGDSIEITNESNPNLSQEIVAINRKNYFEYSFGFEVYGLDAAASQFKNVFGWLVLIHFLDGSTRFLTTPSLLQETDLETNINSRAIQLQPDRPTVKTLNAV